MEASSQIPHFVHLAARTPSILVLLFTGVNVAGQNSLASGGLGEHLVIPSLCYLTRLWAYYFGRSLYWIHLESN